MIQIVRRFFGKLYRFLKKLILKPKDSEENYWNEIKEESLGLRINFFKNL
jgi:hypothetical protein